MSKNSKMSMVGWHGVVAEAPEDWSLAALGGDEKSGYFRVDSPGTMALEVKWSKADPKVDLESKVNAYLSDLDKKAKKRKIGFDKKVRPKDDAGVTFTWRADRKAQGRIWRCDECDKVIIAQVSGLLSQDVSTIAGQILGSIQDHSSDGWRTWAMYGLAADVPPGYVLQKHQLMSGYIQLIFKRKSEQLTIERWGLANVALKNKGLKEWFSDRACLDLAPFRFKTEDVEFESETGLQVKGRRWGIRPMFQSIAEVLSLQAPAVHLDSYVWLCETSNKIYSVQSVHSKREDVIDQVLERVVCH